MGKHGKKSILVGVPQTYPHVNPLYTYENDTGPDDANHAQEGMYLLYDPKNNFSAKRNNQHHLMDVAPTVLDLLGVDIPGDMLGKSMISRAGFTSAPVR